MGAGGWWLMLSRFVRVQLLIFTIASIIGVLVMVFAYMQVPTLLGVGKITVTLELPASGGLYRFSNVTYRGVEVGKVIAMDVSRSEATATLRLNTSPKIPADLTADVRSVSAVGEQYVDLLPRTHSPSSMARSIPSRSFCSKRWRRSTTFAAGNSAPRQGGACSRV